MRAPVDDVTRFWGLGSEATRLGTATAVRSSVAPALGLANYLYDLRPTTVADLDRDLADWQPGENARVVVEPDTPAWVEAELLLRGWELEQEYRLVLPAGTPPAGSARPVEVQRAAELDPNWSARGALFRLDHLEEDARHGDTARPQEATDAIVAHRRRLEQHAMYLGVEQDGELAGFLCCWRTPEGRGVIEDVFVQSRHRRTGLASALVHGAVGLLRDQGCGDVTLAAEVGDTPVHLYRRLGFRPSQVVRSYPAPRPTRERG
ncbi:GNAT family N-acetyltransferase [Microlunatus parietis]|uniref:GNAT superfamily N-acetyltransferase n=1 Tax=Microlunatus parietis TaxID=682979 RepID=A0A7Y9IBJ8_9ACTN|nr:GNAT family N-acetyltransferase [Microlunatus parietis]NYE73908.1 GNAT superfamily N-acetyltransferase [Microlunatus parietis]